MPPGEHVVVAAGPVAHRTGATACLIRTTHLPQNRPNLRSLSDQNSSLTISPTPAASAIATPAGAESLSVTLSSASSTVSPLTTTVTVLAVSPGLNVTVVSGT